MAIKIWFKNPEKLRNTRITFDDCPRRKWLIQDITLLERSNGEFPQTELFKLRAFPLHGKKGVVEERIVTYSSSRLISGEIRNKSIILQFMDIDNRERVLCFIYVEEDSYRIHII